MPVPRIDVDLDAPPGARWAPLRPFASAARELCSVYVEDLGGLGPYESLLEFYEAQCVAPRFREELDALAAILDVRRPEIALANLYYDALKFAFSGGLGCTAFAVDTATGPLHARNLDWHEERSVLSKHTLVSDLWRGGALVARTVGWPGFVGAFSGVAPGRFAITLNAVLSDDAAALALPVTFLIREVLETAPDFDAAVLRLCDAPIACDCLLLVTGAHAGQRAVIERTPTRHAIREPEDLGPLVVTNDYRALTDGGARGILGATACARFDAARQRANTHLDEAAAFGVLRHPDVQMLITVQQMVFRPATGAVWVSGEEVS